MDVARSMTLSAFIEVRDSLRHERIGGGGREVCVALTSSLDDAITSLVSPVPDGVAIVALGGYGRGELSPHSDVDLMLLHDLGDPAGAAASLFRPLWDAKLRVGHSVRTVREAASAAKERFDTQTTLLTSRLVAGSREMFDSLKSDVAAVTRARPLRRYLVEEEKGRRAQTPYLLMATDVKTGRGGLRTLHGFDWERRRQELIGRFSPDFQPEEAEARETLIRIRNALHVAAGRSHDVFSVDLREQVARWLGSDVFEVAGSLVAALQVVDRLATQRWPEVVETARRDPGERKWFRLTGRSRPGPAETPGSEELVWMLQTGERGRLAYERLWDAGHLAEVLPEWQVVRCLPQLAPFHEHPVDAHLWRTVAEMRLVITDQGHYGQVADGVGSEELLLLCAFLHDIGKGHGRDHSEVGAEIARSFARRVSLSEETSDLLEGAVRHHLLLIETATRRDLNDPAVVEEVATTVGGPRLLETLYLLTVADSRATGSSMWSDWKATLLRTLYVRCAALLGVEGLPDEITGTTQSEVLAAASDSRHQEVQMHLSGMPEDYLRSTSLESVLWHLDLISGLSGASRLGVRPGSPVDTAVVLGWTRPGFRRLVAESFAANGIDVLEARLFTRADGLVVDTFQVRDDQTGDRVSVPRWESTRRDIEASLLGELDTVSKVAARAAVYLHQPSRTPVPRVECSVDSATGDVVVGIRCSDRIGRLAEILAIFAGCGLEVRLAKLDSRGDELVDTFHVMAESHVGDEQGMRDLAGLIETSLTS